MLVFAQTVTFLTSIAESLLIMQQSLYIGFADQQHK